MSMLNIDDIHVYYGAIHAIKGVSFEVNEGEIVALIGANGAGKSTILKTVSGLMHPRQGSITFCGENITHIDSYKLLGKGLAHVPEGRRIFLQMSVQENLEMGAFIKKTVDPQDLEMVFQLFPRLKERRKQVAGTLSGGEQQMLAMSRALMSHPKLMMLDEPSMGLNSIFRAGRNSPPAVTVRERICAESVKFRYRQYSLDGRRCAKCFCVYFRPLSVCSEGIFLPEVLEK